MSSPAINIWRCIKRVLFALFRLHCNVWNKVFGFFSPPSSTHSFQWRQFLAETSYHCYTTASASIFKLIRKCYVGVKISKLIDDDINNYSWTLFAYSDHVVMNATLWREHYLSFLHVAVLLPSRSLFFGFFSCCSSRGRGGCRWHRRGGPRKKQRWIQDRWRGGTEVGGTWNIY